MIIITGLNPATIAHYTAGRLVSRRSTYNLLAVDRLKRRYEQSPDYLTQNSGPRFVATRVGR